MRFSILVTFFSVLLSMVAPRESKAADVAAYLIVDNQTGFILEESNSAKKLKVASLTKIATAMVALDWSEVAKQDLGVLATVPPEALGQGPANPMGLQAGDQLSCRDLLYAALLQSDNIAAYTLAAHIGTNLAGSSAPEIRQRGPVSVFVSQMNALANSLRMAHTKFLNPHGLDGGNYGEPFSSAADIARLSRQAMSKASFRFIVSQKERRISIFRGGVEGGFLLHNTNELLGQFDIDGVKTGKTMQAGECLVLSSARSPETRKEGDQVMVTPRRITVVLLGTTNRFGVGANLVNRGWQLYDQWAAQGRPQRPKATL